MEAEWQAELRAGGDLREVGEGDGGSAEDCGGHPRLDEGSAVILRFHLLSLYALSI